MHRFAFQRSVFFSVVVGLAAVVFSGCLGQSKAGLQILSSDIPSTVYIDGKETDKTPYIQKEMKVGEYSVEIRPDDTTYVPYQTKVSLKKGMLTVISWKPGKRPETSGGVVFETEPLQDRKATELVITTIPDGGIIYVDGVAKGFAPVTVQDLNPGEHNFEVKLPSYEPQAHPINILEGYRILVTAKLGKQDYQSPPPQSASSSAASSAATASASPTPAATPTVSEKVSSGSASPTVVSSSGAVTPPKVVVLKTNFVQDGKEVLRVRSDASAASSELGFIAVGSEHKYLGEVKEGWAKIDFNGQAGWVSKQFVQIFE